MTASWTNSTADLHSAVEPGGMEASRTESGNGAPTDRRPPDIGFRDHEDDILGVPKEGRHQGRSPHAEGVDPAAR